MVEFNQTRAGESHYLQGFGGDTSNMAIAAARQGARTAYVTRVGGDEFGRMLLDLWRHEGVETQAVATDKDAHTGVYFVNHDASGHVFSYLRSGSAASRMRVEDLPLDLIRSSAFLQASGISLGISANASDCVLAAFEVARASGVRVALDSNLRLKLWPLARARAVISAAAAMERTIRCKSRSGKPSSRVKLALKYKGCAPSIATSLSVPFTARQPTSPPGKNRGETTCPSVAMTQRAPS